MRALKNRDRRRDQQRRADRGADPEQRVAPCRDGRHDQQHHRQHDDAPQPGIAHRVQQQRFMRARRGFGH
ncbi:MAG: hypothetical protein ABR570_03395 [Burkholderiales bacterium]